MKPTAEQLAMAVRALIDGEWSHRNRSADFYSVQVMVSQILDDKPAEPIDPCEPDSAVVAEILGHVGRPMFGNYDAKLNCWAASLKEAERVRNELQRWYDSHVRTIITLRTQVEGLKHQLEAAERQCKLLETSIAELAAGLAGRSGEGEGDG